MRNIFLEKSYTKWGEQTSLDPLNFGEFKHQNFSLVFKQKFWNKYVEPLWSVIH